MNWLKGKRTLIVNGTIALLPAVDWLLNNGELVALVMGAYGPQAMAALGAINILLRLVTDTKVLASK